MARKSRKNLPQPEQAAASVLIPELEEAKMPAAIYGRLSVEDEETEESMETQIALVQDYINRSSELSYVDTYFDNGFTGTNFKRPAFTRLMNDVRQKKIKCIVVKDLSRFGRNYLEAGYYIETVFPFLDVRLIAVTDNFDSRRISEVQEQIEQFKAEESVQSVVPGTVRAAAEQAENFLNGTRLTASMVLAFIENVFVYDGGRIVVRFKYEQSIQDAVKALHTG